MLSPKKTKYRKQFKGRIHGLAKSGFTLKETGLAISNDGIGGWECSW